MSTSALKDLHDVAQGALQAARAKGAQDAAARVYRVRDVTLQWRDGQVEKVTEATTRGLGIQLYVDGRYSGASTSDLRPEAVAAFLETQIALTRALTPDPFRTLPDPRLYEGQARVDLQLEDPRYSGVTPEQRRAWAKALEEGARAVKGKDRILSVTTGVSDTRAEAVRVHSNGFAGERVDTSFFVSAEVSVQDPDGRRPEDYSYAGTRFVAELPDPAGEGRTAAERTLGRVGAHKGASAVLTMVIENRAAGRLVGALMGPLSAQSIQQKRSFLEGQAGQAIGSPLLEITDDPHIPKGFGSRLWDGEGLAARPLPIFEAGLLRNYYVDTYYGKKLGLPPTTAGSSNLRWKLGAKDLAALLRDVQDGILVTGFLGGNSNATTGDFSLGVQGYRVRGGLLAEPVSEMNIAGNQKDFWKRLVAVGSDPFPYSAARTPTLVFEGVQFAGA